MKTIQTLAWFVALGLVIAAAQAGGLSMPAPKRVAPPEVEPVTIGKLRVEAIHWGKERGLPQNGGYILARDADSGKELWTLRIYRIDYDEKMESDVQDIFIDRLNRGAGPNTLEVVDERGRRFDVDLETRSVTPRS